MDLSDTQSEAANRRAAARTASFPAALSVRFDRRSSRLIVTLASGLQIDFSPRDVEGLEHAAAAELVDAQISPSGMGLHFPNLDVDIYPPALVEGYLGSKRWMASQMGKVGGKASTDAKAAAARSNGRPGGRPRKTGSVASG